MKIFLVMETCDGELSVNFATTDKKAALECLFRCANENGVIPSEHLKREYENVMGEKVVGYKSDDENEAEYDDTYSVELFETELSGDVLKGVEEALEHASRSCHHPACECKGEYLSFPERYCTCHVQKNAVMLAALKGCDVSALAHLKL